MSGKLGALFVPKLEGLGGLAGARLRGDGVGGILGQRVQRLRKARDVAAAAGCPACGGTGRRLDDATLTTTGVAEYTACGVCQGPAT